VSDQQINRRSVLSSLAAATTVGLAGCSQSDDSSGTNTSFDNEPVETESSTTKDNDLPGGVSYPEPDKPATEITFLKTSNDYEVVIVEADQNGKYIGKTIRVPKARFVEDVEGYLYFSAYANEDGRSPREGFALRTEDVEQTVSELRANDSDAIYEIEGSLYGVESIGGGNVLILGGSEVTVTVL